MTDEKLILKSLTTNLEYTRKVTPFLQKDYFTDKPSQALYLITDSYFRKYGACPTPEVLNIEVEKLNGISQDMYDDTKLLINNIINSADITANQEWLVQQTEDFVKERALFNALNTAIQISNGNEKRLTTTAIPQILSDALAIDFNVNLGHDYIKNAESQYEWYNSEVSRVATGIDIIDEITNGGFPRKTLNTLLLGTHVGKTLLMCNIAASTYMRGSNVLYITLEESENKIRQRIDSNLLNIDMDDLIGVDKSRYMRQLELIKVRAKSRLVVKEFPTASASILDFEALLAELKLKEGFIPDLICIDYLGICVSARGSGSSDNSNTKLQGISEELRGFANRANAALLSGQQLNRGGAVENSDPDMSDVADSFGSLFVADFVLVGVAPREPKAKNMMLFIQQKNRHRNINYKPRFIVGVDTDNMRIYDIDDPAIQKFHDTDTPVMDNTPTGKRLNDKAERFKGIK